MTLAAVVVTYNRLDQLKTTLTRLLDEAVDHIIVVNNASSDDTGAWLDTQDDPRLHPLHLAENTGGAGGFEAGLRLAHSTYDPDWTVLMDDDARPEAGAMARFTAETATLDADIGCVAAAVFYPNGTLCEMNRPSQNPFWSGRLFRDTLLKGNRAGFHLADSAFTPDAPRHPIDIASFVGYFINRHALAKAGYPEGGLFIYGDDVLYSLRLRRAGIGMVLMPSVRFEHDCGTMGQGFIYRPLWKIFYHCRNGVSIARQAAGPLIFPAALLYYIRLWHRRGAHYTDAERRVYRRLMWRGIRHGLMRKRGRDATAHAISDTLEASGSSR